MNMLAPGELNPFKLTVDAFRVLDDAGVFAGSGRAELIEGMLVAMSPQQRPHSFAKNELTYRLRVALEALGSPFAAQSEPTVALSPHSALEPDIVLTDAPRGEGYVPAVSLALAVEIADSSLRHDLGDKKSLYAHAGVPEYWVVDVAKGVVHRFWQPSDGVYRAERPVQLAGELRSLTIPDLAVDGASIL